jgi:TatD DNase family protein
MRFYDAHNHLQDDRFAGRQDEIVSASRAAGVAKMVVNGACESDWPAVLDLARRHPDLVIPSFGYHPWYIGERTANWWKNLRGFLDAIPSAVGEIGLDRWKPDLPWEGQEEVFIAQLRIAAERNLPVSIHCLQAWGRLVEILEREPRPERGFLLHSFGGSTETMERLAPLGAYFSLPGYFARERKSKQRETFLRVPPDRLLIETDAPDQLPPPDRITHPLENADGKPLNHPANLRGIYEFAAQLFGEPLGPFAARIEENFVRFFNRG